MASIEWRLFSGSLLCLHIVSIDAHGMGRNGPMLLVYLSFLTDLLPVT